MRYSEPASRHSEAAGEESGCLKEILRCALNDEPTQDDAALLKIIVHGDSALQTGVRRVFCKFLLVLKGRRAIRVP